MTKEFQPEPSNPTKCSGSGCGHSVIGYSNGRSGNVYCGPCAESLWQLDYSWFQKIIAADRQTLGDEAFTRLVFGDGWVSPSGKQSVYPDSFYFHTDNHKLSYITGSSGYSTTPEEAWTKMADKIDRYLRDPYREEA